MQWSEDAEHAIRKVPFFVRKKVRARVEKEAAEEGKTTVTLNEVNAARARFISGMDSEIKGYQVDTCFGQNRCPNKAVSGEALLSKLEKLFEEEDILDFLRETVEGSLKLHHEFRVSLAECPNACSQPQIKDVGIIGSRRPDVTNEPCSLCDSCTDACDENAVSVDREEAVPVIDSGLCIGCGKCIDVCPAGTIAEGENGFRIQLGGKLGRHPRLASELQGLFSEEDVLDVVRQCVRFYKKNSKKGKRFAEIYDGPGFLNLKDRPVN